MKTLLLFLTLFTGLTSTVFAGFSAKAAIRTLARDRGTSWLDRIVQVGGDRGMDQPQAWHIVARNEQGGLQEFFVGAKGIVSEGRVPAEAVAALGGPRISQKKWTFDSTNAFTKAEAVAKKAKIGYDSATYRLRGSDSGIPVWTLQLNNAAGQKVAEVTVHGATGKASNFLAFNPAPPPPPAPPQTSGQVALERTKEAVNRGTQSVGRGLIRAGGWVRRQLGTTTDPAPPYQEPPVTPRGSAR